MSSFFGLNISRLGMQAQQKALEVTAHNVANANTPGYSRQVATMATTIPLPYPEGQGMLGSGVKVEEIARVRDEFLDVQIRNEVQTRGQFDSQRQVLDQIERIFMEPSETGFNTVLSNFFDSWQEVSLNPEGTPVRAALVQNSNALVNSVKHINEQLKGVRTDIDENVDLKLKEVNSLAEDIKNLNRQIINLVALNDTPGDLMDRRDLLVDRLSELIDFNSVATPAGSINIFIGGRALVRENTVNKLSTGIDSGEPDANWPPSSPIIWERDGREVQFRGGEIAGLLHTRDEYLKDYMHSFESMVWGVVDTVNEAHAEGMDLYGYSADYEYEYEGEDNFVADFFTGGHLEYLKVNEELAKDVGKIAASAKPADMDWDFTVLDPRPGDGSNALRIAQLRNKSLVFNPGNDLNDRFQIPGDGETGVTTFENYYKDTIARLGVDSQESTRMVENQDSLLNMMFKRRDSISGVSLDEELANMVQFQLAYQASARVITTIDEILDTIINRMLR